LLTHQWLRTNAHQLKKATDPDKKEMRPELTPETGSPSQGKQAPARRRAWLHTPDEPETLWRVVEVVAVARDDGDGAARPTVDDGAGAPFEVDAARLTDYDATFEDEALCADLSNLASRAARDAAPSGGRAGSRRDCSPVQSRAGRSTRRRSCSASAGASSRRRRTRASARCSWRSTRTGCCPRSPGRT
jgi:hypothetical protein